MALLLAGLQVPRGQPWGGIQASLGPRFQGSETQGELLGYVSLAQLPLAEAAQLREMTEMQNVTIKKIT